MPIPLTVNGVTYQYPQKGNQSWGPAATAWANAVTNGMLQKAGGSFTLTNEVDFGANYGLKSIVFKSRSSDIADAGVLRQSNTDLITWRNGANDGNNTLGVNSSNVLLFNGSPVGTNFITAVSDTSTIDLTVSSDTLSADIQPTSITNSLISISAAIARSKLANGTANRIVVNDASGIMSDAAAITAARALISDANGIPTHSSVTSTELGYVSGVTSAIQTQLGTKLTDPMTTNGDLITRSAGVPARLAIGSSNNVLGTTNGTSVSYFQITNSQIDAAAAIVLSKLATQAAHTFVANNTGSTAVPTAITATQATAELDVFTSSLKGLAPSSGGGTTNFLRADGTWAAPPGGGSGVTTVGTIDSQTKSADGAVISGTSLVMQTADASNPGLMSTGTQTIAGQKTFSSTLNFATTNVRWTSSVVSPILFQIDETTNSTNGDNLTIQAQNATGTTSIGGSLILAGGTGTSSHGNVTIQIGGGSKWSFVGNNIVAASSIGNIFFYQGNTPTNSATGFTMNIQAQNATGTNTTGGKLVLTSGTGTTADGNVEIQTGGTTRLTANATGTITIANLNSAGIVHTDSSGNLTTSLVVNGDITTGTIALTKLATQSAHTFVANATGSTASPTAISATAATAELDTFTSSLKGLAPASGGGTTNFLRADGTWAAPSGGITNPMTTTGDMIYSSSGSTPARLAIGATDAVMQVSGGLSVWSIDRNFVGTVSYSAIISPTALSGDVNNYNPTGLNTCNVIRIDGGAANRIITGLTAPATSNLNRVIFLINIGTTNSIFLSPESGSSTAANRFASAFTVELEHGMGAHLWYDTTSSRWRVIAYS